MKAIGGYFELELSKGKEYYPDLIKLNTGRNCLEYILKVRNYKKVYIPYYTCEVILEPLKKLKIDYDFYHTDKKLNPVFNTQLNKNEAILINNYFGIKNNEIINKCKKYKNIIVDNCQSFYDKPIKGIDTFYSARKFFGVADGAYLSIDKKLKQNFGTDISYARMTHLLKSLDKSASIAYNNFKKNDDDLIDNPIRKMSNITQAILKSIDYDKIKLIREKNFLHLHSILKEYNELEIDIDCLNGPMVYPLLMKGNNELRAHLIKNKIYVATYWSNVFDWCKINDIECNLVKYILPLPIDQRYNNYDMENILSVILSLIKIN